MRISRLVPEGRHPALDGERPHVKVRQRVRRRRGEGLVIGSLKSRHSKRDVPIPRELANRLAAIGAAPDELVFRSAAGSVLDPDNLASRVLAPACVAAGVEWAGFHTFRRTVASRLFAEAGTWCRCSVGSVTTRRASRSTPTFTCSTTTSASRWEPVATRVRISRGMARLQIATTMRTARR